MRFVEMLTQPARRAEFRQVSVCNAYRLRGSRDASGVELWPPAAGYLSDIKKKLDVIGEKAIDEIDERPPLVPDRE